MTRDEIIEKIKSEDEWVVGALMTIYSFQTADEQAIGTTVHHNKVGFNGVDADIMSSFAEFYEKTGFLTSKQIGMARRLIQKYGRQLESFGVKPLSIKKREEKKEKEEKEIIWAGFAENQIQIKFKFPYGDARFSEYMNKVKSISGRKWNPKNKTWMCPYSVDSVESLIKWGFDIAPKLMKIYEESNQYRDVEEIKMEGLYPFQNEGVKFGLSRDVNFLLGDEMGLGKTVQALACADEIEAYPLVIVCPASLKLNWEREVVKWLGEIPSVIFGKKKSDSAIYRKIIIINYDILDSWLEVIKSIQPKCMIVDESHYIKNQKTKRTKAVKKLRKWIKHAICLSGTPITNRPVEFFTTLNLLRPDLFPSFWNYAQRYCAPKNNGYGWDFTGSSNTKELHEKLSQSIMIRRLKAEVLKDLPEKQKTVIPIEIKNRKEYSDASMNIIKWIKDNYGDEAAASAKGPAEALVEFEKLKQISVNGKIDGVMEWVTNFLDGGQKLVLFATHHKVIDKFKKAFGPVAVKLDGRDSPAEKQKAIDSFQNDDSVRLFIGNIKAAGVGITLTASHNVAFVELGWTPGEMIQAEDRCHRIGQSNSVNIYYLIAHNTIEEDIAWMLDKKAEVISSVLDGKDVESGSILTDLLDNVLKERKSQ